MCVTGIWWGGTGIHRGGEGGWGLSVISSGPSRGLADTQVQAASLGLEEQTRLGGDSQPWAGALCNAGCGGASSKPPPPRS